MRPGVFSLHKAFEDRHPSAPGRTLIVGSNLYDTKKEDRRKRYADCVGVDQIAGNGVDLVLDMEGPLPESIGLFNHIECCSVLEHSKRPWLLAENIQKALVVGGTLYLTVPFVWRVHDYPSDYWRFTREAVAYLFDKMRWHELIYAHAEFDATDMVPIVKEGSRQHPYLARTEVFAFGERV